ncbi:hypothetical protein V491_06039 [Pseudogymnoascus sp. VKM F-3775]|nr:hypothetical protein V491_06039 [Pseudogymnoascus sp. VKM F-3775]
MERGQIMAAAWTSLVKHISGFVGIHSYESFTATIPPVKTEAPPAYSPYERDVPVVQTIVDSDARNLRNNIDITVILARDAYRLCIKRIEAFDLVAHDVAALFALLEVVAESSSEHGVNQQEAESAGELLSSSKNCMSDLQALLTQYEDLPVAIQRVWLHSMGGVEELVGLRGQLRTIIGSLSALNKEITRGAAEKGLPLVYSEESRFDKSLAEININSSAYERPVFAGSSKTPQGEPQAPKTLGGIKITSTPYERSVFAGPSKSSTTGTADDLFRAISEDDLSRVEELLDQGVDIESRDGSGGRTPLIASVGYDKVDIAELLLRRGADTNAKTTNSKETALISACGSGRDKIITLILQFGNPDLEARDRNGRTALMRASAQGYGREMRMLVKAGADLDAEDKHGSTAYIEALRSDHGQAARLLMNLGARII